MIVVLGAGTGGLLASLSLARAGQVVTLVEKDPVPAPVSAADALERWRRPGTPQALLPHAFMGRARELLLRRAPDLLDSILAAGALDFELAPFIRAEERTEEDAALRVIFCRRPLLESELWRAVERETRIAVRTGVPAAGLLLNGSDGRPSVRGLRLATGETIEGDLLVDAAGRRSPVRGWLKDAGASLPAEQVEECGVIYYSRYYALLEGQELPKGPWLWGPRMDLPYGVLMVHLQDQGVFSISLAMGTSFPELRAVRHEGSFEAACALLAPLAPWTAVSRPISPVLAMGGIQNVLRPFFDGAEPIASGLLPLGDTICHTNAIYGWGVTIGMEHAFALVDLVDEHGTTGSGLARAYHARVWPEAEARWRYAAGQDRARSLTWRGHPPDDAAATEARFLRQLMRVMMTEARLFRAFMRFTTLLDPAERLMGDAAIRARVGELTTVAPASPWGPPPGLEEMLEAVKRASPAPGGGS